MFKGRYWLFTAFIMIALLLAGCTGGGGTGPITTQGSTVQGHLFYDYANDDFLIQRLPTPPLQENYWEPLAGARVALWLNDQPVGSVVTDANGRFGFDKLAAGNYDLLVYEPDGQNRFLVDPKVVPVRLERNSDLWVTYQTKIHYLLVGPNNVDGTQNDVAAMDTAIQDNTMNVGIVRRLTGSIDAYDVLREIRSIGQNAQANDDFVFYFSGYTRGGSEESFDYLYFGNSMSNDRTAGNFLTDGELEEEIFAYFERATVIIDGTDAMSFADGTVRPRPIEINPLAFKDRVYTLLGASRAGELSSTIDSGPGSGLGLFTYALTQGLGRAGTYARADTDPRDRTVTSLELHDFVRDFMNDFYADNPDPDADNHQPVHVGFETVIMRY